MGSDEAMYDPDDVQVVLIEDCKYVRLDFVADLLARNGVQWPNRSGDISERDALKQMWEWVLEKHFEKA